LLLLLLLLLWVVCAQLSMCCVVLCCVVLCCVVLDCVVLCCVVLCCIVLCCIVLSRVVLCCIALCCVVLCCAVLCCAVLSLSFFLSISFFLFLSLSLSLSLDLALSLPFSLSRSLAPILNDDTKRVACRLQLAAVVDAGEKMVSATHKLEGDGFLAPTVHPIIEELRGHCRALLSGGAVLMLPNTLAVVKEAYGVANVGPITQALQQTIDVVIAPAMREWEAYCTGKLRSVLDFFHGCVLFDPSQIRAGDEKSMLDDLLPHLTVQSSFAALEADLRSEWVLYCAACAMAPIDMPLVDFWLGHAAQLPAWTAAARLSMLYQPSSASAERVFSMLDWMYTAQQQSVLSDHKTAAIMIRASTKPPSAPSVACQPLSFLIRLPSGPFFSSELTHLFFSSFHLTLCEAFLTIIMF
jgi:hypothetical protein